MSTILNEERIKELRDALKENSPWGAAIRILDSVNLIEEFEELVPILDEFNDYKDLVEYYRMNLIRWKNPQLPAGFRVKCPLLTARLDTPQKIRILLRAADFCRVEPLLMGEIFEDIIYKHDVKGEMKVIYPIRYNNDWYYALKIVYHSQIPAWTFTEIALLGHTCAGHVGGESVYIDWTKKKEKETTEKIQ